MRLFFVVALLVLSASSAEAASPSQFRFSGEVQANHEATVAFGFTASPGSTQVVDLPSGLKLEVSAPSEGGNGAQTRVRLLRVSSSRSLVLHESVSTGPPSSERSFSYLVCGTKVTFLAPAPAVTPQCKP